MSITVWTYLLYLTVSLALTIWVAHTLHKNGRIFLVDIFRGREALADSVNHLLLVGFYLVNLGYVLLTLKVAVRPHSSEAAIEVLAAKLGLVLLVLGGMHFLNLYVFHRLRRPAPPRVPEGRHPFPPAPQRGAR